MVDPEENRQRLAKVEQKVTLLVKLGIAQTILLVVILVMLILDKLLPNLSTLVMFILIVGAVGYVFRQQLPTIFGQVSRYIFAQLATPPKDGSSKDIS